jgi:hypothetical protein
MRATEEMLRSKRKASIKEDKAERISKRGLLIESKPMEMFEETTECVN